MDAYKSILNYCKFVLDAIYLYDNTEFNRIKKRAQDLIEDLDNTKPQEIIDIFKILEVDFTYSIPFSTEFGFQEFYYNEVKKYIKKQQQS